MPVFYLVVLWLHVFAVFTPAQAQINSVANGQTVVINAHGTCYRVTNNGGPTTMIPTRSAAEWSHFISYRPGFISLSSCCTTEGPYHNYPGGCAPGDYWARTAYHINPWHYCWNGNYMTPPVGSEPYCPGDGWCYNFGGGWYDGIGPIVRTNC